MVRARVLADAGASKSTGNNRHKSPTPNTSSGRTHPPASLSGWFHTSARYRGARLARRSPRRLWRLSDKPGDLTSLAAHSLLASCQ